MGMFTELQKLQLKFQLDVLSLRKGVYMNLRCVHSRFLQHIEVLL